MHSPSSVFRKIVASDTDGLLDERRFAHGRDAIAGISRDKVMEVSAEPQEVTRKAQTPRCRPDATASALTALTPEEQLESPRKLPEQRGACTIAQTGDRARRAVGLLAGYRWSKKKMSSVFVRGREKRWPCDAAVYQKGKNSALRRRSDGHGEDRSRRSRKMRRLVTQLVVKYLQAVYEDDRSRGHSREQGIISYSRSADDQGCGNEAGEWICTKSSLAELRAQIRRIDGVWP